MFLQAKEFNNGSIELDPTTGEYVASSNPGPELYFNTSNVLTMFGMFSNADLFNSPIYRWDVSNVTTFQNMFQNSYKFEQEVRTWNVNSDKTLTNMFQNIAGNDRPFGIKYGSSGASNTPSNLFWNLYSGLDTNGDKVTETINDITYTYRDHMIDIDGTSGPDNYKPELIQFNADITNDDAEGTIATENNTRLKSVIELYIVALI